jgi:hypothetical protein
MRLKEVTLPADNGRDLEHFRDQPTANEREATEATYSLYIRQMPLMRWMVGAMISIAVMQALQLVVIVWAAAKL